jgi:glycine cleavage system H protein
VTSCAPGAGWAAPSRRKHPPPIDAPLSGEVLEVNAEALENPDLVNSDPYAGGWLLRIRVEDSRELEDLIGEEEYAEMTTEV